MAPEAGYLDYVRGLNLSRLVTTLFGAAAFVLLLSLAPGWYSVDTEAEVYQYNPAAPQGKGDLLLNAQVDVEMQVLSVETRIRPDLFDRRIEEYGKPTYDDHAGRSGTVMLGVLMLALTSLAALAVFLAFHAWNRRSRRDLGPVVRRAAVVFFALGLVTLLYFAIRIPESAEGDTEAILDEYQPSRFLANFPTLHPDQIRPSLGLWKTWRCCPLPQGVYSTNEGERLVLIEVRSNPSAGFWLFLSGQALAGGAFALAARRGAYGPKVDAAEPPPAPPPTTPKVA